MSFFGNSLRFGNFSNTFGNNLNNLPSNTFTGLTGNPFQNGLPSTATTTPDTAATDEDSTVNITSLLENDFVGASIESVTASDTGASVRLEADGTVTYDPNGAFEYLAAGEIATDTFTYTVLNALGQSIEETVTVTVTGANDAPVAADDVAGSVSEDGPGLIINIADLLANDSDADAADLKVFESFDATGLQGALVDNGDGTLTYTPGGAFQTLGAGDVATESFTYTVSDGKGGTSTATVSLDVLGANDAAVITGEDLAEILVGDATEASGQLIITDIDDGEELFNAVVAGTESDNGYGTFAMSEDGTWTYLLEEDHTDVLALAEGETMTDSITVSSVDGTEFDLTVNIVGNDAPEGGATFLDTGETLSFTTGVDADVQNSETVPFVSFDVVSDGDRDWFEVVVPEAATLHFDVDYAMNQGHSFDSYIYLYQDGSLITQNDDSARDPGSVHGYDSELSRAVDAGTYQLEVERYYDNPIPVRGTYELQISMDFI